jgi:hypothetical protein
LLADVQADFDQAAVGFADELLGARDPFAGRAASARR